MSDKKTLEFKLMQLEAEIKDHTNRDKSREKALLRFLEAASDVRKLRDGLVKDPFLREASQRYFGLDPLKISALNVAFAIEADELRYTTLQIELAYRLMLANLCKNSLLPNAGKKLQTQFSPQELALVPSTFEMLQKLNKELEIEKTEKLDEIQKLRSIYEQYLFVESSHEASRSFGSPSPRVREHHSSWVAFAQLLTSLAVKIHEQESPLLLKKTRKIDAKREAIFERCAEIFTKLADSKDVKKRRRQLSLLKEELEKLESELVSTLAELSVPGMHDYASFIMKKTSEGSKTTERNILSQRTGEKT